MYHTVHLGTLWTEMGDNSQMVDQDNRQILGCPKIIKTNGHYDDNAIASEKKSRVVLGNLRKLHVTWSRRSWAVSEGQEESDNKARWFKSDYYLGSWASQCGCGWWEPSRSQTGQAEVAQRSRIYVGGSQTTCSLYVNWTPFKWLFRANKYLAMLAMDTGEGYNMPLPSKTDVSI